MHGLASSYYLAGRPADAVELHREVLAVRRRVLPKDHPATLGNIHILAFGYSKLGRHAEAAELFEEALAGWRRVLPPDHPDLLTGVHDLAACYRALGRHSAALALFHEALAGRSRALPPDHPNRWSSLDGVAASLVSLNRGDEAIPLVDEFLTQVTGTTANSAVVARMTELRLRHFQHANDPAGCRATAEMWEKLNRPDSSSLYDAARYRAVAAAVYAKKDQPVEAAADADRAMAWLTKAVAAGWTNRAHAERDADLNFLRDRADFRKLLASLPHPAPPPREVKR